MFWVSKDGVVDSEAGVPPALPIYRSPTMKPKSNKGEVRDSQGPKKIQIETCCRLFTRIGLAMSIKACIVNIVTFADAFFLQS